MPHPTPNKVTSWLRVKKYSWGRNPVVGVKILDIYLRCSSRCRCPGNLPEMRWAWLPWQQADPQWRQCSQTGVCQTHRFASEHSKTGWGRHSLKSCIQRMDIILIESTWMQSGIERETTLDIRPFSTRSNLQGRQKLQIKKVILEQKLVLFREPVERESQPWSKSSPKGLLVPVLRACFPSIASRLCN